MATTRAIGKQLEEMLDECGDGIQISTGYGNSRFNISAHRSLNEIKYVAGGPNGLYLSLALQKKKGHWKVTNYLPEQKGKLLINKMFETSYKVLKANMEAMSELY